MMDGRQTGYTTQQMNSAPPGAVFVWCDSHTSYPMKLAKKLGRDDLVVRPLSWLGSRSFMGAPFTGLVIDHAARPDSDAIDVLRYLEKRGVRVMYP